METITLEQVYYLGQTVGVVVVIASLLFVGVQLKQNTRTMQTNAAQAFVTMYSDATTALGTSGEVAKIWMRGMDGLHNLNSEEVIRFSALFGKIFKAYESAYVQWRNGALSGQLWSGFAVDLQDTITAPGIRQCWSVRRRWYGSEFRAYVDECVKADAGEPIYAGLEAS